MMTMENRTLLRVFRRFTASAERVFDAFLDPDLAGRFMFVTPTGEMVRVEIDARIGGRFTFTDRRNGEDVEHTGEYLEIERPRRLVFTLTVPKYSQDTDRITLEITPSGAGCDLALTHEMAPEWEAHRAQIEQGWAGILEGASRVVA